MPYRVNFVIRQSKGTGDHYCGAASKLPLSNYTHVADVASYYGNQLSFRPAQAAILGGEWTANYLDRGHEFSHEIFVRFYHEACDWHGVRSEHRLY